MADTYVRKIIKRNWKGILIFAISVLVLGFIVKNVGEIPYENRYQRETTHPIQFHKDDERLRGFVNVVYWVKTPSGKFNDMTEEEVEDYLDDHANLELKKYEDKIIASLKNYTDKEIEEYWYDETSYFLRNNPYFTDTDPKMKELLGEFNLNDEFKYEIKRTYFVYLKRVSA